MNSSGIAVHGWALGGRTASALELGLRHTLPTDAVVKFGILRHTSSCRIHYTEAVHLAKIRVTPKRFAINMILYPPVAFLNGVNDGVVTSVEITKMKVRERSASKNITTICM